MKPSDDMRANAAECLKISAETIDYEATYAWLATGLGYIALYLVDAIVQYNPKEVNAKFDSEGKWYPMGYCVHLSGQKFCMSKVEECVESILNSKNKWMMEAVQDAKKHVKYFEHLPPLLKLVEFLYNTWGFKLTPNQENVIVRVDYEWEKMGDFDYFCNVIAKFVEPGSYLEFTGEDSAQWRYVFVEGGWKEVRPQVVWPEC